MKITEYFSIDRDQSTLDFVNVDIRNDIPLFVDPRAILDLKNDWGDYCISQIQDFFQTVLDHVKNERHSEALNLLTKLREPNETHLGLSSDISRGTALGDDSSEEIWRNLTESEAIATGLIENLEDTALLIPGISIHRISDITINIIRDALIIYTQRMCAYYDIPVHANVDSGVLWDTERKVWQNEYTSLPFTDFGKLVFVPKAIVRRKLTFNADEYYRHFVLEFLREREIQANTNLVRILKSGRRRVNKKDLMEKYGTGKNAVIEITKNNPLILNRYREYKDRNRSVPLRNEIIRDYTTDDMPDFDGLYESLISIDPGRENATHYENAIEKLLTALFYPSLTNPEKQSEIHNGRKRIDITYTNTAAESFFAWLSAHYSAPFIFIECKNYSSDPSNPEIDQLSGRFSRERGRVGFLVCRTIENKTLMIQRCKDTANDGRGFIIPLDDSDLKTLIDEVKENFMQPEYTLLKSIFKELVM